MIRIWSDGFKAGVLDRLNERGSTFAYNPLVRSERAVSVTMPVRVQSWDAKFSMLPIFEMNLPEGELRRRISRRFAKATGEFDDIDLLSVVGRSQIGRIRYSALDQDISQEVPFQSVDEIIRARRDGGLFDTLLEKFAIHSGLSGVQPKIMIRATGKQSDGSAPRQSPTIQSATHIVKLWEAAEYPELAANEFYCLTAAKRMGLTVPHFQLSEDGGALIVDRFDLYGSSYLGFEDFCVLNALRTEDKYSGGYETRLFKRTKEFIPIEKYPDEHLRLFKLFVLNCAIRNGDAHLKNFGVIYSDVLSDVALAPVYDLVTTLAYDPNDTMALTLEGSTNWPDSRRLARIGQIRIGLAAKQIATIFEEAADALADTSCEMSKYFAASESPSVGERMVSAWSSGVKDSLGFDRTLPPTRVATSKPNYPPPKLARSDGLILELLRAEGGKVNGTKAAIARKLSMPATTFGKAVRRLVERGFIASSQKRLSLLPREVGLE